MKPSDHSCVSLVLGAEFFLNPGGRVPSGGGLGTN